jgi:hypothetical protein
MPLAAIVCASQAWGGTAYRFTPDVTVLSALATLSVDRYSYTPVLPRIWELRHRFTGYDAAYKGHGAQVTLFAG